MGVLGLNIKSIILKILNEKKIFIYHFIFILFIINNSNVIHLDDTANIILTSKDGNFEIKGAILSKLIDNFGNAMAFSAGARIAALLLSKHTVALPTKFVVVGSSGIGTAASLKYLSMSAPNAPLQNDFTITAQIPEVVVSAQIKGELPKHPILDFMFGTNIPVKINNVNLVTSNGSPSLTGNVEISPILSEAKKVKVDWSALSPLENNNSLIGYLIDNLNNHLIINIVTVYLLLIVFFIICCKFLLNNNLEIKYLNKIIIFKYPIGIKFNNFIKWYINIFKYSSNI
jgi:hypothetical protein